MDDRGDVFRGGVLCICVCLVVYCKTIVRRFLHGSTVQQLAKDCLEVDFRLILWWWFGGHGSFIQCNDRMKDNQGDIVEIFNYLIVWLSGYFRLQEQCDKNIFVDFQDLNRNHYIVFVIIKKTMSWTVTFKLFCRFICKSMIKTTVKWISTPAVSLLTYGKTQTSKFQFQ